MTRRMNRREDLKRVLDTLRKQKREAIEKAKKSGIRLYYEGMANAYNHSLQLVKIWLG